MDSDGNFCGHDAHNDYPKLYFPDLSSVTSVSTYICVDKCPTKDDQDFECKPNNDWPDCTTKTDYKYNTVTYLGAFCVPDTGNLGNDNVKGMYDEIFKKLGLDFGFQIFMDVLRSWWLILICSIVAVIFSFLFMWLIEKCTKVFIWVGIVGVLLIGFVLSCWVFSLHKNYEDGNVN